MKEQVRMVWFSSFFWWWLIASLRFRRYISSGSRPSDKGGRVGGGVLSLLPWIPSPGSATAAILSWHSPFDYTKMSLPPLFPGVTCKGTWEGYKLTQKVISWLLLHSSQGALQDALPLILWNLPQSVILLPLRPASLTHKNPQRHKIIYGMHLVEHEIP